MKRHLVLILMVLLSVHFDAQTHEASSHERDELAPGKAFDGDSSTRWSASFKESTGWIQCTYPTPVTFDAVRLSNGIRDLKGAPRDVDVLAGEGADLHKVGELRNATADDQVVRFPRTSASTWRIVVVRRIDERWSPTLSEIRFSLDEKNESAATPGGEVTLRPTRWASSAPVRDGKGIERAFDGNPATAFEVVKGTAEVIVEFAFDTPTKLDALRLISLGEGAAGVPRDWTVEAKTGSRWRVVATVSDSFNERATVRFSAVQAGDWRLKVTAVVSDRWGPSIQEIETALLGDGDWPAEPEPPLDQTAVNRAIERGLEWLKEHRGNDGTWSTSHSKDYPLGVLSLGGLALRKSGLDRDDPLIADLVARSTSMPLDKVYSVAVHAMFLHAVSRERFTDRLQACATFLVDSQATTGLWGYPDGRPDLSNAQYALLGLHAAADVGIDTPTKLWQRVVDGLVRDQTKDGGFGYVPSRRGKEADPTTGSMTAAGLACLHLATAHLEKDRARIDKAAAAIERAAAWLDRHYTVHMNPGSHQSHYYWLYGLERVGAFVERERIGGRPWYRDGAAQLVDWQWRNGSWRDDFADTCFALLFLRQASVTRGR